ncbi:hypothetical protein A1QO_02555 [Vibrio genomosp. F10 str. ZF-129]|uniref:Peptidase S24/S26A/S26B/S26C domain-containing protein n=1 Tax=Vibrio genomosp. F10 str. ZF-129 TaxID=1187848 RepID=A0A1E5BK48_9VIBR|nr:S24 family peptidase [Vibrio genomosp. F10]OEE38278.1 hypothetical protein A1QO_02555 [Vibrio genomosp. F10 str. ZF-129]
MISLDINCGITGFENPTHTFLKQKLSLTQTFVHSPSSSSLISSPCDHLAAGIKRKDWLLVDSACSPLLSDVVLLEAWGELAIVKWGDAQRNSWEDGVLLLGVVILSIHHYRDPPLLPFHENMTDLDLHQLIVEQDHSTIFCRAQGLSMMPFVYEGDLLVLERHLSPREHDAVVVALNHDLVLKRLDRVTHRLYSDNPSFKAHHVTSSDYVRLHGVVRYTLRLLRTPQHQ